MTSAADQPRAALADSLGLGIGCRSGDALPPRLVTLAASHVRDTLGVALAAAGEWRDDPVTTLVRGWGGEGRSTAIGRRGRHPIGHAAMIGGTLAHAIDFDDTHLPSVLHPSAAIVPAALACAEAAGADGRTLLAAVAFGDEVCCRLGMAGYDEQLRNSVFFENGLHATAICGDVGAAGAAALALGLSESELARCYVDRDQPRVRDPRGKPHRRHGEAGSLRLGGARGGHRRRACGSGLTGAPTAIEGRFGFLRAFCGETADADAVTRDLGERWELDRLHVKPYPTNHFTHSGIDAALRCEQHGVTPADIDRVEIRLAQPGPAHGGRATRAQDPSARRVMRPASAHRSRSPRRCGAEVDWVCSSTI